MTMALHELKKIFRIKYCAIAVIILLVLCANVPQNQVAAMKITHIESYPDQFTLDDGYSVDVLFQDFLLDIYGNTVTKDDLPDLQHRKDLLLNQVANAAASDEVLLRIGTKFNAERAEFFETDPDRTISEADQVYEWSCVNGQMKLAGTDYPIGFIKSLQTVIAHIQQYESYKVLGRDILSLLRKNLGIVTSFSIAALALVIPYGVSEARSRTETLAYTTKTGRKAFIKKVLAIGIANALVIAAGVHLAFILFSSWQMERFYACEISSAMTELKGLQNASYGSMSLIEYYVLALFTLYFLGVSGNILAGVMSLHIGNAVSAIACCLPVIAGAWFFRLQYLDKLLDYGRSMQATPAWEPQVVTITVVFAMLFITWGTHYRKNKYQF